jgi:hypothetical protein
MRFQVQRVATTTTARSCSFDDCDRYRAARALWLGLLSVLERIEASGYRVFGRRLGLSFGEKLGLVARTYLEKSPSWVNMSRRRTA